MNEMQVVHKQEVLGKMVDVYGTFEQPFFLAKDVSGWIGHTNTSKMVSDAKLDKDEVFVGRLGTLTNSYSAVFLTEDGLYEVLMLSRKKEAKEFKKKIKTMLKSVRLTGGYVAPTSEQDFIDNYFPSLSEDTKKSMVTDLNKKNKELHAQLEAQKPLVAFAEVVNKSDDSLLVREYVKAISKRGFVIGEKRMFQWLRDNQFIDRKNVPYQRYIDQGLFEVTEYPVTRTTGIQLKFTTRITAKGQVYFYDKLTQGEMQHG